jgi:hypothetical protein
LWKRKFLSLTQPRFGTELQKEKPMNARAKIDPGICQFHTVVTVESEDSQHVTFEIETQCESIKELAIQINEISPVYAIGTLGPDENPILSRARRLLQRKGCCEACVVPAGTVKIMQVATNLALPKDVSLSITKGAFLSQKSK